MPKLSDEDRAWSEDVLTRANTIGELFQMDGVPRDLITAEALMNLAAKIITETLSRDIATQAFYEFALSIKEKRRVQL